MTMVQKSASNDATHRSPLFAAAVIPLALLAGCSEQREKPREERVPVAVAAAVRMSVPVQVRAIGTVEPISTVAVRALAGGQLTRVSFREGQDVRRGDLLFTIDPRPYKAALAQAEANLARDEANLRNAESERSRYEDLVKKDYVTREEYDRISAGAEAARAVVGADRAAIETTRLQLSYCEIHAPIDGRTGTLMVHAGNLVRASDTGPLVIINQIHPVYVRFSVPEAQLGPLRARGVEAVPVIARPQGGAVSAAGKLTFVDNAVDASTGTIALKATFENASGALWPGQFVTIALTLSERPDAVVIPAQAVQTGQRGQFVYVVKGNGIEMRPVVTADAEGDRVIVEKGVSAGETVVTDGQLRLTPKSQIEIKTSNEQ